MTSPVRVAVIGCGKLGTYHARLYRGMAEANLVALVDIEATRAHALGNELGVPTTTDLGAVLSQVDAVSIAAPTEAHFEIAARCLEAGAHVLVEKPLTRTTEEGAELVRRARAAGRILAVGHVERFNPAFRAVRVEIGRPRFIESHRLAPFVPRSLDIDVVQDLMIHDLDLVLSLVPAAIESLDAVGVPVLTPGADIANARLRFADGTVANLTASRVSRERVRKIRFFGPQHYHSLDLGASRVERALLRSTGGSLGSNDPGANAVRRGADTIATPIAGTDAGGGVANPGGASAGANAGGTNTVANANAGVGTSPDAGAGNEELQRFLSARGLTLDFGEVAVAPGNALEEELRDFLRAVRGDVLIGADGEAGLRCLELAGRVQTAVQQSLQRLGLAATPPAS